MASLVRSALTSKLRLKNTGVLYSAVRNHWFKDYKAGPYPKTEEERIAAAKKYGIPPEEYETYPDDGTGYGDYPKLPIISAECRDPYYPWDNPELKRNFNEPLHVDEDMYGEDRYNASARHHIPEWLMWVQFLSVFFGGFAIYLLLENVKLFPGRTAKQLPEPGTVHYTFEPRDDM